MDPHMYRAVIEGDSRFLSQLLKAEVTEEESDLLQIGVHSDNVAVVGDTLLHIAANFNNVQVVKVIRENLPSLLRTKNYRDDTALHIAARHNNPDVVEYLLEWAQETDGAENRSDRYHRLAKLKNSDGNTALHEAVIGRHREVIEVLMDSDKYLIFMKNKRKESPLYLAADRGLHVVLDMMLNGALDDENFKNRGLGIYDGPDGRTPLHAAIAKKHTWCVYILLDKMKEHISTADDDGRYPFHYAVSFGHSDEASLLLRKDASIAHQKYEDGLYPIHIAANKGYVGIIQAMLRYCPETIETLNRKYQNVVHLAANNGRANLVSYMLHQKSNKFDKLINAKDTHGDTPLHLATKNSHPKVVNILVRKRNIDMSVLNEEGLTALDIAVEKHMHDTISLPKLLTVTALRINGAPSGRPSSILEENTTKEVRQTKYENKMLRQRFSTLVLVATLTSTVTFAAGFTVPGGYNADGPYKGIATLLKKPAFNIFVICNTIALYLSIIVAVNNIWAQLGDIRLLIIAVNIGASLLGIALIMMAIAFAAGLYSVIHKLHWLAAVVLVIVAIFLFYIVLLLGIFNITNMSRYRLLRKISKWVFNLLIFTFDRFFDDKIAD